RRSRAGTRGARRARPGAQARLELGAGGRVRGIRAAHPVPAAVARGHRQGRVRAPLPAPRRSRPAMILVPGVLISALTFPGVIVHEAAHMLFCRLLGLAVLDVAVFRLGKTPAGWVVHEPTDRFGVAFFVGMGPFIVNTVLCLVFCAPAFIPVAELELADPLAWFFFWLGIS